MKFMLIVLAVIAGILLLGWLGLQFKPRPFARHPQTTPPLETVPLPSGLPAPVERFYQVTYGDQVPVIRTAVMKGRAEIAPFGVKLPARFLFVHNAGKDYRHYIEATWFGFPLMKVNESYVNGSSHFELPIGTFDNDPSITQGAALGLWAEAGWFPSIWVTDPRAHWQAADEKTALLFIPFGQQEENFVVRFDPKTGLIDKMEAMRYRDPGAQAVKILWITQNVGDTKIPGTNIPAVGAATWLDQGKPWAIFTLEDVVYNVDVSSYIQQKGP